MGVDGKMTEGYLGRQKTSYIQKAFLHSVFRIGTVVKTRGYSLCSPKEIPTGCLFRATLANSAVQRTTSRQNIRP